MNKFPILDKFDPETICNQVPRNNTQFIGYFIFQENDSMKTHLSRFKKRHPEFGSGFIIFTHGKYKVVPRLQIKKSSLYQHREERMRNKYD
tara:strand:- start:128 stop:400 length:273 start_codon:yes stop_codon:yes gene_type:complete